MIQKYSSMSPLGGEHAEIAARLVGALSAFVQPRGLGRVFCKMRYHLEWPLPYRREPGSVELELDISFVTRGRGPQPGTSEYTQVWNLAPDLAVEIAALSAHPSRGTFSQERAQKEMRENGNLYSFAGTRLVWIIYPYYCIVDVRRREIVQSTGEMRWWWETPLYSGEQLDGFDVLPGFTYPLRALFPALDGQ